MSLINHLPALETEEHWDSDLHDVNIRFPKQPAQWTLEELEALYLANKLDPNGKSAAIQKACHYWEVMLTNRKDTIVSDIVFKRPGVRAECALEQSIDTLAVGLDYANTDAHIFSDRILKLLADIEQDFLEGKSVVLPLSATTVERSLYDFIHSGESVYKAFGIELHALKTANSTENVLIQLPKLKVVARIHQDNFKRLANVLTITRAMVNQLMFPQIELFLPCDELFDGGQCKTGIKMREGYYTGDKVLSKGIPVAAVSDINCRDERYNVETKGMRLLCKLMDQIMSERQHPLDCEFNEACIQLFDQHDVLHSFIHERYQPKKIGLLPDHGSLLESEERAQDCIHIASGEKGQRLYNISISQSSSSAVVVTTNDWLFALKLYRGHREVKLSRNACRPSSLIGEHSAL